jgi:hypothetical protein
MSDAAGLPSFIQELGERKVWRTAILYLVVGFGLVEASNLIFPQLEFPLSAASVLLAVLLFCFPIALAAAWHVGGIDRPGTASRTLPVVTFVALAVLCGWLGMRALPSGNESASTAVETAASPEAELPLVIMMDSAHPSRVYDQETLDAGATNADVISDILLDLPIRRQRELIGPDWHRDQDILQFDPDLIVIHYSGFRQGFSDQPRERLRLFISYFVDTDTRFLIYSRQEEAALRVSVEELLGDLESERPGLLSRVSVFGLESYGSLKWRSPLTSNPLKLRVKEILGI